MKYSLRVALCLLISLTIVTTRGSAQQKSLGLEDGADWLGWTQVHRLGYISGFVVGASLIMRESKSYFEIFNYKSDDNLKPQKEFYNQFQLFDITMGQLIDGLSSFYGDFSNRKIQIVDAVYIVKLQLNGDSPEHISAQTRYLKLQPISKEMFNESIARQSKFIKERGHPPGYKEIKDGEFSFDDMLKQGFWTTPENNYQPLFCRGIYR